LIFYGAVFCLGAAFGSFLGVCIYRLPSNQSIISPASFCPACSKPIQWYDNIPILSFVFLKAKCRYCRAPMPWSDWWVEIAHTLLYLVMAVKLNKLPQTFFRIKLETGIFSFIFVSFLVLISVIDLKHGLILDKITLPFFVFFLASSFLNPLNEGFLGALEGAVFGGGFLALLAYLSHGGIGGGDIKFGLCLGSFLGWRVIIALAIAFIIGSLVAIILLSFGLKTRKDLIPFGPFLAVGSFIVLLWRQELTVFFRNFLFSMG